ncbi:MAG: hypothetical protein GX175_03780, partial [Halanaerobiaceae bacterium]|nr:hypothetical protein [Halanaerobiaceae bacterium]
LAEIFYKLIRYNEHYQGKEISFTGHSLGGGLAQYAAVMSSIDYKHDGPAIYAKSENAYIHNVKNAVTWNAIGIKSFSRINGYEFLKPYGAIKERVKDIAEESLPLNIYEGLIDRILKYLERKRYVVDGRITELFLSEINDIDIKKVEKVVDGLRHNESLRKMINPFTSSKQVKDLIFSSRDGYGIFDTYENIKNRLEIKRRFSLYYEDGEKFNNKVINYINSKDLTSYFAEHIGTTYIVDKGLEEGDSDNFLPNIELKSFAEYHGLDVFYPYILLAESDKSYNVKNRTNSLAKPGDIVNEITYTYLQAVIKAIMIDLINGAPVNRESLAVLYEKYKQDGDQSQLISVIIAVLQHSYRLNNNNIIEKIDETIKEFLKYGQPGRWVISTLQKDDGTELSKIFIEDKNGNINNYFLLTGDNRRYKFDYALLEQLKKMQAEDIIKLWRWEEEGNKIHLVLGSRENVIDYSLSDKDESLELTNEEHIIEIKPVERKVILLSNAYDIFTLEGEKEKGVLVVQDSSEGAETYKNHYDLIEKIGLKSL